MSNKNEISRFTTVHQCRFCGSIIPSEVGVERHGEFCRPPDASNSNLNAMASVNFPCPVVVVKKMIFPNESDGVKVGKTYSDTNDTGEASDKITSPPAPLSRRQSSLRAIEKLSQEEYVESDDKDSTSDNDEKQFTDGESEGDSESEYEEMGRILPKRKRERKCKHKMTCKIRSESTTESAMNDTKGKYACPYKSCGRIVTIKKLKQHFLLHLENSPYQCSIPGCKKNTTGPTRFREHMESHKRQKLTPCEKCGIFIHKGKLGEPHECKVMKKEGNGIWRFDKKPGPDNDKAEDFKSKKKITITDIIESDPVFLEVCEENPGFRELMLSRRQGKWKRDAMGEKYKCMMCESVFSNRTRLVTHVNDRHTPRPFECNICGKTFLKQSRLDKHKKLHEDKGASVYYRKQKDGMWSCTKCGFESKFECSISRHWLLIHKVRVVQGKPTARTKSETNNTAEKEDASALMKKEDVSDLTPGCGHKEELSCSAVKIECEPPLELAIKVDLGVKQDDIPTLV